MKEKYIFLTGLGTGIVITAIISLFSYNIIKPSDIPPRLESINTSITEISTEPTSTQKNISNTETTKGLELSIEKPLEINTNSLELSTQSLELSTND